MKDIENIGKMSAKMTKIKKKKQVLKAGKADTVSFWLFNAANILCTMSIIGTAMIYFIDTEPVATFNISVYAIFQSAFSLMLNVLFHKAAKNKEVYLDD